MAIHIYQCVQCKVIVEHRTRRDTPPPEKCKCGGDMVIRPARTSFVLQGGGWAASKYE